MKQTFSWPAHANKWMAMGLYASGGTCNFKIREVNVELSNKATDWSPAPEDVQARIDAEKARINDILSDNVADPSEKQYLQNLWNEIYAEYPRIWAQAYDYGVDRTAYGTAYTNLNNTLTPVLADLTTSTSVSGATIRTRFSAYYDARTALQNAITNKVNQNAGDAAATAADALEKANTSKAITDNFGTQIGGVGFDSALISTVLILLRELNSQQDTAGISGIQGAMKNNPAYWSGGTYAQAFALIEFLSKMSAGTTPSAGEYSNLAKITMLHNGAAKVGDFIIEESGRIVMVDPETGKPRLVFGVFNIPTVADLLSETQLGDSVNTGGGAVMMTTPQMTLSGSVTVSQDNSTLTFGGTLMTITAFRGLGSGSAQANIEVLRNGIFYANIGNVSVFVSSGESGYNEANIEAKILLQGVPTGTYTLRLSLTTFDDIIDASATAGTSTLAWSFSKNVEYFQFGLDGMMLWHKNFHLHMSKDGGLDGRALPGKWNAPGVLLSASVQTNGGFLNSWGAKKHASSTAVRNSAGRYTVYHSVGHTNYQVTASSATANRSYHIVSRDVSSFIIEWRTIGSSPALSDTAFDFQITGNNYN